MRTKKIKIVFILELLSILLLIYCNSTKVSAKTTGTKTIADGEYTIKTAINENYSLDISGSSKKNEANLLIWPITNNDNQKFIIRYLNDGTYSITAKHSGKLLDVWRSGKKTGTNVQQYQGNNSDNQKWIIKDAGNGYYTLISKCNNLALNVNSGKAKDGQNVEVSTQNNSVAQKFKMEKIVKKNINPDDIKGTKTIADGEYTIKSALNTKYSLDISGSSKQDEANLLIWPTTNNDNEKFIIKYLNNGAYSITAKHSGKLLDVAHSGKVPGTNVQQYSKNNSYNQMWVIKEAGNGYYTLISKCNNLALNVNSGKAKDGQNVEVDIQNSSDAQKFKFEKVVEKTKPVVEEINNTKTIADGEYTIKSALNTKYSLDISGSSRENGANLLIWSVTNNDNQRFIIEYLNDGTYKITIRHSGKVLDVESAGTKPGTNVQQFQSNNTNAQKWIIKDTGKGYYTLISKCNNLALNIKNSTAKDGQNVEVNTINNSNAQKFKIEKVDNTASISKLNTSKYPGYKEKILALSKKYPNWKFEFLYTHLNFRDAVSGEAANVRRNLVPSSYGGEWIIGTNLYDSGWYSASEKAIAYYMDPRNFLDEDSIFQFLDVNSYAANSCTIDGINSKIKGTYLANYANDINNACLNKNVNPYYVIARLLQEQGNKGGATWRMVDTDKNVYYNPFNIGATGDGTSTIIANALNYAKKSGWNSMQKAIEGGIYFLKANWLENYQNTLYQNRFDIDKTNGSALYVHQYMQNLMGAYSEAKILKSMYANTGKMNSIFKFIIPLYENMGKDNSPLPSNRVESTIINVKTTGTKVNIRENSNTDSKILKTISNKATVLLSIQRGINGNWQKVVDFDGTVGYISGDYVTQIDDVIKCKYTAYVKTNDGDGCYARYAPTRDVERINPAYSDGTKVTVIDDSTYRGITGYDWSRCVLENGAQVFFPSAYLKR